MKYKSSPGSLTDLLLPLFLILGLGLLLNTGQNHPAAQPVTPLESWLKTVVGYLAAVAEVTAAVVIGGAISRGLLNYLRHLFARRQHFDSIETIRLQLGRVLVLGLEFTVASDILRTAVAPTRKDISSLAAIVLLRTLLNYFLEREIHQGEQNRFLEKPIGE